MLPVFSNNSHAESAGFSKSNFFFSIALVCATENFYTLNFFFAVSVFFNEAAAVAPILFHLDVRG